MKERFHQNEIKLREKCHQNDVLLKALAEIHSKDEFSPILNLCLVFEEGKGVEQDLTKTVEFYEMSAGQGNSHAFVKLGKMYIKAKTFEVNYPKAFKYFNQSAKLGNSEALVNIGQMCEKGRGVKQNISKAIKYYQLAAKKKRFKCTVKFRLHL